MMFSVEKEEKGNLPASMNSCTSMHCVDERV